jgi:hypothetical protein
MVHKRSFDCSFKKVSFSQSDLEGLVKCELTNPQPEVADGLAHLFLVVAISLQ